MVKVGRYLCPVCRRTITEDSGFWDNLTDQFFDMLAEICQLLRIHHVSYEGIESVLRFLIPRSKETIRNSNYSGTMIDTGNRNSQDVSSAVD